MNSIGETIAGVGTEPKLAAGIRATSTITVMPPPGHTYTGAPPQVTLTSRLLIERVIAAGGWRTVEGAAGNPWPLERPRGGGR